MRAINNIGQPIRPLPQPQLSKYDGAFVRVVLCGLGGLVMGLVTMWLREGK